MLHNPMKIHSKGEKQTLVRPKKINNKNKEKEKEKGKRGKGEKGKRKIPWLILGSKTSRFPIGKVLKQ